MRLLTLWLLMLKPYFFSKRTAWVLRFVVALLTFGRASLLRMLFAWALRSAFDRLDGTYFLGTERVLLPRVILVLGGILFNPNNIFNFGL